jgi:hypothetical protein
VDGYRDTVGGVQACPMDTAAGQDVGIGAFVPLPQYFGGLLDDVRNYDYALETMAIAVQAGIPMLHELEAQWDMNAQSGLVAGDSIGGHTGQVMNSGGNPWMLGKSGNALVLDGVDDYVTVPEYKGIVGKSSRTCAAWVKTSKADGQIVSWGGQERGRKWVVRVNNNGTLRAEVQNGWIYGMTPIHDGQWHHVAVVLDSDGTPDVSFSGVDGYRGFTVGGHAFDGYRPQISIGFVRCRYFGVWMKWVYARAALRMGVYMCVSVAQKKAMRAADVYA